MIIFNNSELNYLWRTADQGGLSPISLIWVKTNSTSATTWISVKVGKQGQEKQNVALNVGRRMKVLSIRYLLTELLRECSCQIMRLGPDELVWRKTDTSREIWVYVCVRESGSVFTVDEERKPMNVCLLKAKPKPLKVNPELISTTHSGLPRAELSNQTPAAQAAATSKFGLYFKASNPGSVTQYIQYML